MTHWRHQHDHGLAEQKRLDARFDRIMTWLAIGLPVVALVVWGIALS